MRTCDLGFEHADPDPDPVPVPVPAEPATSENDVKIAEVTAAADVERERIWAEQRDADKDQRIAELEGELRGVRELLEQLQPADPAPAPVVVDAPPPAPEPEPAAPPPVADKAAEPKPKAQAKGFFNF